jgi:hypothetical protein
VNNLTTRRKILFAAIIILLMANYYFYDVRSENESRSHGIVTANQERDWINHFIEKFSSYNVGSRDIFENATATQKLTVHQNNHLPRSMPHKTIKPNPSPSLPTDNDQATQLNMIKVLGIVLRANERKCYLAFNAEKVIANTGETVFGNFIIDSIDASSIVIRERQTGSSRRILVSGK